MDTKYPESLSRILKQRDRRKLRREETAMRHRTQPITFSEIQEVDEDNIKDVDEEEAVNNFNISTSLTTGLQTSKSVHDMHVNTNANSNIQLQQFLLLNINRTEKKRTKKSLNKLTLNNITKPIATIPQSPENQLDNDNTRENITEKENENFKRIAKTPRTSI